MEALRILSSASGEQEHYLQRFFNRTALPEDFDVDELALQFDDAVNAGFAMREANEISEEQLRKMKELDDFFTSFSGKQNGDLWTVKALREHSLWNDARLMARDILSTFGSSGSS